VCLRRQLGEAAAVRAVQTATAGVGVVVCGAAGGVGAGSERATVVCVGVVVRMSRD
jgi:hypothetical protein